MIAATYPALSETFVYREVEGLRARDMAVTTVALRTAPTQALVPDVAPADVMVYGDVGRLLRRFAREAFANPARAIGTLWRAFRDAFTPGAAPSVRGRAKGIGQAIAGIGLAGPLRAAGVEHVHCQFAHAPTSIGMYAARQLGLPFSFVGHANDLFERQTMLRLKLERAAFVSCISEWHRAYYESIRPRGMRDYPIVRCGVPSDWTSRLPKRSVVGPRTILFVGRLLPKKGVLTLVDAFATLDGPCADVSLHIIGDGPLRDTLVEAIAAANLGARVTLAGAQPNDVVQHELGSADVFCLPCEEDPETGDRDGVPVSLMEAMASGVATIGGDLPAIRELIRDGESGRLVPGGDPIALAAALREILTDDLLRVRLAEGGRARVLEEFTRDLNLERLMTALGAAHATVPTTPNRGTELPA